MEPSIEDEGAADVPGSPSPMVGMVVKVRYRNELRLSMYTKLLSYAQETGKRLPKS